MGVIADLCRDHDIRAAGAQVLGVVGVELVIEHDFTAQAGARFVVAQHRTFHFAADDGRFDQHLAVKGQCQCHGRIELDAVAHLAHAHRGALVGRLDEQRQAQLGDDGIEVGCLGAGGVEADERGDVQAGITQQALGHILVHAGGRADHIRADEGQFQQAQQALQGAVLATGAVDDREDHIDGRHAAAVDGLQAGRAAGTGHHAQLRAAGDQGDRIGVIGIGQPVGRIAQEPAAVLVHADQHGFKALGVQGRNDIARRLQRDLVFGRLAAENDANPGLAHACVLLPMRVRCIA